MLQALIKQLSFTKLNQTICHLWYKHIAMFKFHLLSSLNNFMTNKLVIKAFILCNKKKFVIQGDDFENFEELHNFNALSRTSHPHI